jgi:hypothetical protein
VGWKTLYGIPSCGPAAGVLYKQYTSPERAKEDEMDFMSRIQPRDWMIAVGAFIAGAFIF